MHSSLAISIQAPPARIFELACDVTTWPQVLPHYRNVTVQSRDGDRIVAVMVAKRYLGPLALPITWRAEHWPDATDPDDLQLHFRHVRGVTRGMVVTWHIRPDGNGRSRVTIEHEFRRPLPLLGDEFLPRLVSRFFIRPIAGRTLATFRSLAERAG